VPRTGSELSDVPHLEVNTAKACHKTGVLGLRPHIAFEACSRGHEDHVAKVGFCPEWPAQLRYRLVRSTSHDAHRSHNIHPGR
jgi:hypothetical protein